MKMTKFALILGVTGILIAACSSDDKKDSSPSGDGDKPKATGGAGGANENGGAGGTEEPPTEESCSNEEWIAPESGVGGDGGAPSISCEMPQAPKTKIAIKGSYTDDYGGSTIISNTTWDLGYAVFTLSLVNNEKHYAIARNAESSLYDPCAFSTFVWHEDGDELYMCQSVFAATSECAAQEASLPDSTDLEKGCGGFPWSQLKKK